MKTGYNETASKKDLEKLDSIDGNIKAYRARLKRENPAADALSDEVIKEFENIRKLALAVAHVETAILWFKGTPANEDFRAQPPNYIDAKSYFLVACRLLKDIEFKKCPEAYSDAFDVIQDALIYCELCCKELAEPLRARSIWRERAEGYDAEKEVYRQLSTVYGQLKFLISGSDPVEIQARHIKAARIALSQINLGNYYMPSDVKTLVETCEARIRQSESQLKVLSDASQDEDPKCDEHEQVASRRFTR